MNFLIFTRTQNIQQKNTIYESQNVTDLGYILCVQLTCQGKLQREQYIFI